MLLRVVDGEGLAREVGRDGVGDQSTAEEKTYNDTDTGCFLSDSFFAPRCSECVHVSLPFAVSEPLFILFVLPLFQRLQ